MTAPALVCLAHGSRDPRSAETISALVDEVRALRPDLRIETAFLEFSKPSFNAAVSKLKRAGYEEIVVVPLLLTHGHHVLTLASVRAYLTEPRDVTAAELCLETFIPLDGSTRIVLEEIAGTPQL